MPSSIPVDATVIETAVAHLNASRPAYATMLGFYGPVFAAQARAAADTSPKPVRVDAADLHMRQQEGFALIEPASFIIDQQAAAKLLTEICRLASVVGEKLDQAGQALSSAVDEGANTGDLFGDILDAKGRIQALAKEKQVSADMLSLLLYLAMRPSIDAGVRQLAEHLSNDGHPGSHCPICGRPPIIGELDEEGRQWVHCSFCWHRWAVMRMVCLFCDRQNSDSREYLYSENEPEYRLYLCADCHRYLKVVDTRQLSRGFVPHLEQVASLHLDMMAADKGFSHAMGAESMMP